MNTLKLTPVQKSFPTFGMVMSGKQFVVSSYRYGYNRMENDNELSGDQSFYTSEWRQYSPLLCKWLSIDPAASKYPSQSPYAAFNNNPIYFSDPFGNDPPEKSFKATGVSGSDLVLFHGTKFETYEDDNCDGDISLKVGPKGARIATDAIEGDIKSFDSGGSSYNATYGEDGSFRGYFNETGQQYVNPDITLLENSYNEGGISAKFEVNGIPASGLEAIQISQYTAISDKSHSRQYGRKLGQAWDIPSGFLKDSYKFNVGNTTFASDVDGGANSIMGLLSGNSPNASSPYYVGNDGRAGVLPTNYSSSGQITITDRPGSQTQHSVLRFTTFVVAINYMNTGKDMILGTYRWGYKDFGKSRTGGVVFDSPITQDEYNTIMQNYPNYKIFGYD